MQRPPTTLVLVLHGHIPDVLGHGTWPHGANWLYEAVAETYQPFLIAAERLLEAGIPLKATVGMTPVLSEQLVDPRFAPGFDAYLAQRARAAGEDGERLSAGGDASAVSIASFWSAFYGGLRADFARRSGDLTASFRRLAERGALEMIASAATHGFLPLLPNDRAIDRQLDAGLAAHRRHFGRDAHGIWLPECAYRPGGPWTSPADGHVENRCGLEEFLAERGLKYFFVETHLVTGGRHVPAYGGEVDLPESGGTPYRIHAVRATHGERVGVFARDPLSSQQVWSGKVGYPGDGRYLEFHKKRAPSGHRYWRVTHSSVDLGDKLPYERAAVAGALASHADHFVKLLESAPAFPGGEAPVVVAMFDFELFGHWWFEGVDFLEAVFRRLAGSERVVPRTASEALAASPTPAILRLPPGTWGRGGDFQVWWNEHTIPYWREVDAVERALEAFEERREAIPPPLFAALERQALLLQSSDWPFLIDNEVSKDYAESRIREHVEDFWHLARMADSGLVDDAAFDAIADRDRVFERELAPR
jgi:1,4-alpha-glucan branching enzyme